MQLSKACCRHLRGVPKVSLMSSLSPFSLRLSHSLLYSLDPLASRIYLIHSLLSISSDSQFNHPFFLSPQKIFSKLCYRTPPSPRLRFLWDRIILEGQIPGFDLETLISQFESLIRWINQFLGSLFFRLGIFVIYLLNLSFKKFLTLILLLIFHLLSLFRRF